jgi:branched-chain amino acid transport system permease protein
VKPPIVLLVGIGAAATLPFLIASDFWLGFCITILLFATMGMAWNVLGGYAGQFSFGHAAFFGAGAYSAAILHVMAGVNPWLGLVGAAAAGGLAGFVVGYLSFRYGLRGSYFALITLAFAEVLRVLVSSTNITGGGIGLYLPLEPGFANLQFASKTGYYYVALALATGSILVAFALERSRLGAALTAIRENEDAARALGVDAFSCKLQAIIISGAVTGLCGAFYADYYLYLDPGLAFGPGISVEILLVPIIGGLGTVFGPLVGSAALHAAGELARRLMGDAPGLSLVFYGVLLVIMVRFLPDGLMGLARRRRAPAARSAHA